MDDDPLFSWWAVVKGLIDAYQEGNVESKIAADLAAQEIAAQTAEAQLYTQLKVAEIGHPWEPEKLGFYVALWCGTPFSDSA